jgi:hypothetical protein
VIQTHCNPNCQRAISLCESTIDMQPVKADADRTWGSVLAPPRSCAPLHSVHSMLTAGVHTQRLSNKNSCVCNADKSANTLLENSISRASNSSCFSCTACTCVLAICMLEHHGAVGCLAGQPGQQMHTMRASSASAASDARFRSIASTENVVMFGSTCTDDVCTFSAISTRQAGPLPLPQYTMRCGAAMAKSCSIAMGCEPRVCNEAPWHAVCQSGSSSE